MMNSCRNASTPSECLLEINWPAVLFQQISKGLIRKFLKVFHLIAAEKIDLLPGIRVELHALAGH